MCDGEEYAQKLFEELLVIVSEVERRLEQSDYDFNILQHFLLHLQNGKAVIEQLIGVALLPNVEHEVSNDICIKVKHLSNSLQLLIDAVEQRITCLCTVSSADSTLTTWSSRGICERTGKAGRPKLYINVDQVEYLRSWKFSWTRVAYTLCISRTTLWRRLKESGYNINAFARFSDISNEELQAEIQYIKAKFPYCGERMVIGLLRARSIFVSRQRTRDVINVLDPINRALRWKAMHERVRYSVPGPNALWHIDGLHRLIKWGFVVHGGIDGFSRLVTFLHCSTNNYAETVLSLFNEATNKYGIPSRVRSDMGGENIEVSRFMNAFRGSHRGSHIAGSSMHNQRIERLHRDTTRCSLTSFYNAFSFMDEEGLLEVKNDTDLFCLHYVFLPRINRALQEFRLGWNHHSLSSENSLTPYQLWIQGVLSDRNGGFTAIHDITNANTVTFGIDFGGPAPPEDDPSIVEVSEPCCPLTEAQLNILNELVDPLADSSEDGVDIYIKCIDTVTGLLTN